MIVDDLRAFARDPSGYPPSAAVHLCHDAADLIQKMLNDADQPNGRTVCGACGEPWVDGKSCGQKDNGHAFQTCYPFTQEPAATASFDATARESTGEIMYVCSGCAKSSPENCGHYDRAELRITPQGNWACQSCFEEDYDEDWKTAPLPPFYAAPQPTARADREALELLYLTWQGWANALRLMEGKREQPDMTTLRQADAYEECSQELCAALATHQPNTSGET